MSISIVIAEDDPLLREFLAGILAREPDLRILGDAATGPDALEQVAQHRPDVLLLDLKLPGLSGLQVLERLRLAERAPRVLVLSGDETEGTQMEAARSGASGFVCKSSAMATLAPAITS